MVSRTFLAKISAIIGQAKVVDGTAESTKPFGGKNVVLVGNFHQFPPVATRASAPLFWACNLRHDTHDELVGRQIYEQFTTVVHLREQRRVDDPVWLDLSQHVRHGSCREKHLRILRSLIIDHPDCLETVFSEAPWDKAVLVTPQHAVRVQWNDAMAKKCCTAARCQLYQSRAEDTIAGHPLTLQERFTLSQAARNGQKRCRKGNLPDVVGLAVGMEVMVTFNVNTDLDIANDSRGQVVSICLDEREHQLKGNSEKLIAELRYL
jgi:hypothetical protein